MSIVFVIEDEPVMAECVALAVETVGIPVPGAEPVHPHVEVFNDAVMAMEGLRERLPDAILLDVMLTGPDGFTFLNEMISYNDTAKIPVILVTTLDLTRRDLSHYGVRRILDKATMTPDDIRSAVRECLTTQTVENSETASQPSPDTPAPAESPQLSTPTATTPAPAQALAIPGQTSLAELNRRFAELEAGVVASQQNQKQPPHAR